MTTCVIKLNADNSISIDAITDEYLTKFTIDDYVEKYIAPGTKYKVCDGTAIAGADRTFRAAWTMDVSLFDKTR